MNGICVDVPRHSVCSYWKDPSWSSRSLSSGLTDPQVVLSLVDQHYFGSREAAAGMMALPPPPGTSASDRMPLTSMIWQQVAEQYSSIPHCPGGSRGTGHPDLTARPMTYRFQQSQMMSIVWGDSLVAHVS